MCMRVCVTVCEGMEVHYVHVCVCVTVCEGMEVHYVHVCVCVSLCVRRGKCTVYVYVCMCVPLCVRVCERGALCMTLSSHCYYYNIQHTILLYPPSVYPLQHQEEEMEPHQTHLKETRRTCSYRHGFSNYDYSYSNQIYTGGLVIMPYTECMHSGYQTYNYIQLVYMYCKVFGPHP